jgi:hypothetical protein
MIWIASGVKEMMDEEQIRAFLEDIKSVYMVGYFKDDLTTEAEKWGQIQVLEWILSANTES